MKLCFHFLITRFLFWYYPNFVTWTCFPRFCKNSACSFGWIQFIARFVPGTEVSHVPESEVASLVYITHMFACLFIYSIHPCNTWRCTFPLRRLRARCVFFVSCIPACDDNLNFKARIFIYSGYHYFGLNTINLMYWIKTVPLSDRAPTSSCNVLKMFAWDVTKSRVSVIR